MADSDIVIEGLKGIENILGLDLRAVALKAALPIAEEIRNEVSPYPAQPPPADPDRWYDRGYGPRWRRADGSVGGRKTSEQLGQRWTSKKTATGAVTANSASYSRWVHSAREQAAIHQATGWMTDEEAIDEVVQSGKAARIVLDLLRAEYARVGR